MDAEEAGVPRWTVIGFGITTCRSTYDESSGAGPSCLRSPDMLTAGAPTAICVCTCRPCPACIGTSVTGSTASSPS